MNIVKQKNHMLNNVHIRLFALFLCKKLKKFRIIIYLGQTDIFMIPFIGKEIQLQKKPSYYRNIDLT